jgi:hypothetical protein
MSVIGLNNNKAFVVLIFLVCLLNLGSPLMAESGKISFEGLPDGVGKELVVGNCTICHSEFIILQNYMDRKGWNETIDWMQREQGMWELEKKDRNIILNYLSKYQGFDKKKDTKRYDSRKNQMYEFDYRASLEIDI